MRSPSFDLITLGVLVLIGITALAAALVVFLIWRNGYVRGWRGARSAAPACPACGYNLSGLTHCRCPECGQEYTLEELWRRHLTAEKIVPVGGGRPRQPGCPH